MDLFVSSVGEIRSIYSDAVDLRFLGQITIERASHVEPDAAGQWSARIIKGPVLGPFQKRSDAIAAEVVWLTKHHLTQSE